MHRIAVARAALSRTRAAVVPAARHVRSSSSSTVRLASVLPSEPTPPAPELRPQPYIPRPRTRKYEVSALAKATTGTASTTISLAGPSSLSLTLPNLFLRDTSHHPAHLHPASRQKLFKTTNVPVQSEVVGYGVHEVGGEDCLVMEWSSPLSGVERGSEKLSVHPVSFLVKCALERDGGSKNGALPTHRTWDGPAIEKTLTTAEFDDYMASERTLLGTLDELITDGISFLSDVPTKQKEGQGTDLRKVVERIGSIRKTWYGELWDVRAEEGSRNIAYTNLDLGLHMDLTHFESPPRYQFLHSLLNGSIEGGASYFVDSFHIVSLLRASHPEAYEVLRTTPLLFEYDNGGHHTRWERPTIELSPSGSIHAVNYSPPFQGPLPLSLPSGTSTPAATETRLASLHSALSLFASLCDLPSNQFSFQLSPGQVVLFDNRRVLHARTAFKFKEGNEGGEERGRWLKGAYMDGDEVWSRWRGLEKKRRNGKLE